MHDKYRLGLVRIEYSSGDPEMYVMPMGFATGDPARSFRAENPDAVIADVRGPGGAQGLLFTPIQVPEFASAILDAFARRRRFNGEKGTIIAARNREFRKLWGSTHPNLEPSLLAASEVNTSIKFGDRFVFKLLRQVEPGPHPGVEMGRYLTEEMTPPFPNAAPFAGYLQYQPSDLSAPTVVGVLHGFVPNDGTCWADTRKSLDQVFELARESKVTNVELQNSAPTNIFKLKFALADPPPIAKEILGPYIEFYENIGRRVAQLHLALERNTADPAFTPEPFNDFYRQGLFHGYIALLGRRLEFIRQRYSDMSPDVRLLAAKVLERENAILDKLRAVFAQRISSERTRFHGRLHLGHLLVTGNDVVIFDFEGDPHQHVSERRIKRSPIRDVTSMLVSMGYAVQTALRHVTSAEGEIAGSRHSMRMWARFWYSHISAAFLRGYWKSAKGAPFLPRTEPDQETLLTTYLMERALLDIRADIEDKPELAGMPFRVILYLLDSEAERKLGE